MYNIEQEIIDIYGKSIWDMTAQELYENGLIEIWADLVDMETEEEH